MDLVYRHRPDEPLLVEMEGVPSFLFDKGAEINGFSRSSGAISVIEPLETMIFTKLLSGSPKVLDIGANIGWYTCVASAFTQGIAEVLAFEPEPANFTLLSRNIALNGFFNARSFLLAIGNETYQGKIYLNEENAGDHQIIEREGREALPVMIHRLNTILDALDFVPDLIKIDVQGAEPMVFAGAGDRIKALQKRCAILIEFSPAHMGMHASYDLAETIFSLGQDVFVIYPYEGGQLQPLTKDRLHEALNGCIHPRLEKYIDLLIAPKDSRMESLAPMIGRPWQQWEYEAA